MSGNVLPALEFRQPQRRVLFEATYLLAFVVMGQGKEARPSKKWQIGCFIIGIIGAVFFIWLIPVVYGALTKSHLMQALLQGRDIHLSVQGLALDYANMRPPKGAWPADTGIKTGHEYIRFLYKNNAVGSENGPVANNDFRIFAIYGQTPATSLDTLTPEHIGFRFANVAEEDPPETIFLVTNNFVDNTPFPFVQHWWDILIPRARRTGFIVFRKGGDGTIFTKLPSEIPKEQIGILPPREPKFLAP